MRAGRYRVRGCWRLLLRRLEVHVTEGPREYVGATIRVHAHADTDPGLGPGDVKTSLWKGGQVIAQVSCLDGRFRAHSLRSLPGS